MVPGAGIEPALLCGEQDFKSCASTNSATRAVRLPSFTESPLRALVQPAPRLSVAACTRHSFVRLVEVRTGFEPVWYSFANCCVAAPPPHPKESFRILLTNPALFKPNYTSFLHKPHSPNARYRDAPGKAVSTNPVYCSHRSKTAPCDVGAPLPCYILRHSISSQIPL